MGRLAVYKFAYLLSIIFTLLILGLSVFAIQEDRIFTLFRMIGYKVYQTFGTPTNYDLNHSLLYPN